MQWQASVRPADGNGASSSANPSLLAAGLEGAYTVKSSIMASIAKVQCRPGDVIESSDQVLVVMEALKTEILITAGEEHVGRRVKTLGEGVREKAMVAAGEVLVVLEDA